jgi:hypothetical protein
MLLLPLLLPPRSSTCSGQLPLAASGKSMVQGCTMPQEQQQQQEPALQQHPVVGLDRTHPMERIVTLLLLLLLPRRTLLQQQLL